MLDADKNLSYQEGNCHEIGPVLFHQVRQDSYSQPACVRWGDSGSPVASDTNCSLLFDF
jgi:hypothetical protein